MLARQRSRLGLIGCGEIAAQIAQGIAASAYAEHVMVMDIEERLAKILGQTYGVPYTTSVEELLANKTVDACSAVRGQDPFEGQYRIYGDAGQIIRGSPPRIFVTNAVAGLQPGVWHGRSSRWPTDQGRSTVRSS